MDAGVIDVAVNPRRAGQQRDRDVDLPHREFVRFDIRGAGSITQQQQGQRAQEENGEQALRAQEMHRPTGLLCPVAGFASAGV